ncbi:hypothetical protein E2542_SST19100 [Spatholobus suberectus]|nr:hypothetical protein E2542_SST19100 [Spatholobus suberectus]
MAENEGARGSDESLKLAVAISLLRSKVLKNVKESSALSPSQSDALLRSKRKAKERKQEILRLREDLKDAQVRFKERRRRVGSSSSSSQQRLSLGLIEEDETEQLRASVDFLVELCGSVSPVRMLHYFSTF